MNNFVLQTGQRRCYDAAGHQLPCTNSGQDAEYKSGQPWPQPRFKLEGGVVVDNLTGLVWSQDANLAEFPLNWQEALDYVSSMNMNESFGFKDWRLPNRRELRSLMSYQTKKPALPADHPFANVFLGWYWTSSTAAINTAYAWYVHLEGARMFYGRKDHYYLLWPVRGKSSILPRTGQTKFYDASGREIDRADTHQHSALQSAVPWPKPRFQDNGFTVLDKLTNLVWLKNADAAGMQLNWREALRSVRELNKTKAGAIDHWRLPNINELESLVDAANHTPALASDHPFMNVRDVYWSSTTSFFETDWAWALYLDKGALGVGVKKNARFSVWPVCDAEPENPSC
ncbi:MAG: DUF1566 domain-containing protein [Thermodesulfobacteriota bacterium]